ncbi:MAG: iron ABC transporter permease [Paludibacteraceae bacterium]|nr:iron ABC transporter permease [Paludibacteraceae bacterium]MCR5569057.1 iron ABC transporter permease [Paludibacteraceae bacterium]
MRRPSIMTLLLLSIPLLVVLNLIIGTVSIPVSDVFNILIGNESDDLAWNNIVLKTRLPQTLTALTCGAALSVAGLQMQTLFHNPLAGPSVLGVSSAASLGVAFVVLVNGTIGGSVISQFGLVGNSAIIVAAIAGAVSVMVLIVYLSQRFEGYVTLLIVGVLIGYIASAITGILKYFSSEEDVRAYVIWGLGSFSKVTGGQITVFLSLMAVMLPISMLLAKPLNQLLLGEQYAVNLGLDIRKARLCIIVVSGILVALVTAYCGPIMFIGLAVPHLCRALLCTADHRILLPATLLCGASIALLCNLIARMPGYEGALPINSVTALIGAPVALKVILKRNRK